MVTLDGENLFGEEKIKIEAASARRDQIERTAPGLDGVLSIDLGGRGRKIKQSGVLRARSRLEMDEKTAAISSYMDGDIHTLAAGGRVFEAVRMDEFKVTNERASGAGTGPGGVSGAKMGDTGQSKRSWREKNALISRPTSARAAVASRKACFGRLSPKSASSSRPGSKDARFSPNVLTTRAQ